MPGRVVRRSTYVKEYEELTHKDGVPFVPAAIWKDMFFSAAIIVSVMACAWYFGPFGPSGYPDPTIVQTIPKPDFFFLWLYAMLALLPPAMETPALLIGPVIVIGFLVLLPFLSGEGEKSWKRRPVAVVTLLLIAVALGTFTKLATYSPWSPVMNGWSGDPVPVEFLNGRSPLERQGALVFQVKQCRNCHSIGGSGGKRGPDLDRVATRMTHDQLVRQVIQGGGNMPAYGKNLNPAEVTALVSFLETLRPANQPAGARCIAGGADPGRPGPSSGEQPLTCHAARLSSRAAFVVDSSGRDLRDCPVGARLSARMVAAAARRLALPSALAGRHFPARAVFALGRAGLAHGCVQRLRADRAHAAAHGADDGRAAADPAGRAADPDGARPADLRRARVCRAVLELVRRQTRRTAR